MRPPIDPTTRAFAEKSGINATLPAALFQVFGEAAESGHGGDEIVAAVEVFRRGVRSVNSFGSIAEWHDHLEDLNRRVADALVRGGDRCREFGLPILDHVVE